MHKRILTKQLLFICLVVSYMDNSTILYAYMDIIHEY